MLHQALLDGIPLGSGLIVGVVGPDGRPSALRAWGVEAVDDRLRIVMGLDDERLVEHLPGRTIAVTSAEVRTFRSHQVKGTVTTVREPTEAERARAEAQTARFFEVVHEVDGNPVELLRRLLPERFHTVEMTVAEAYVQTPGPQAGRAVEPAAR